jgi:hypothetical protein
MFQSTKRLLVVILALVLCLCAASFVGAQS